LGAERLKARVLILLVVGAGVIGSYFLSGGGGQSAMVELDIPSLTESEQQGAVLYAQNCASCHGENGAGRDGVGPPLVHVIYEPSHHPDGAFYAAVQLGVRAHHWDYGDMPRQSHVTEPEITQIIAYIRALQRANGID